MDSIYPVVISMQETKNKDLLLFNSIPFFLNMTTMFVGSEMRKISKKLLKCYIGIFRFFQPC